jgi:DNA polymerase-1
MEKVVAEAREKGFVTTLTGRRRSVPEINSSNRTKREFAERIAINTPIQGTAADIMKKAMLQVDGQLRKSAFQARMILQIHDELVLEVPDGELTAVARLLQESMENAVVLDVPLTVHLDSGQNLGKDERISLI